VAVHPDSLRKTSFKARLNVLDNYFEHAWVVGFARAAAGSWNVRCGGGRRGAASVLSTAVVRGPRCCSMVLP
jgi:hypothetical protein